MLKEWFERMDCAKGLLISGEPEAHSAHRESPAHWPGMVSKCGLFFFFFPLQATEILSLCLSPHLSEANLQTKKAVFH